MAKFLLRLSELEDGDEHSTEPATHMSHDLVHVILGSNKPFHASISL